MNNSHLKKLLSLKPANLKAEFKRDPGRAKKYSIAAEHVFCDFSRQLITDDIMKALLALADKAALRKKIRAMFAGEKINNTENRSAAHWALRVPKGKKAVVGGADISKEIHDVLDKISAFSKKIHSEKKIKNIVSIGIGGSYLGPKYLAEACRPFAKEEMNLIFVANVDGADLTFKTAGLKPEETLFVIVSKTFTTAETMKNAETARKWLLDSLSGDKEKIISEHFVAVSTAGEKVKAFGIDPENMFVFWDWVGGRFSATSAVGGLALSLYLGFDNFKRILEGARWMDEHYLNEPLERNIPVMSALLDIFNINVLGLSTRALLPYSQLLSKLAQHTQQVEMESNGKSVDRSGKEVKFKTGEVVFGEPGTNGQHSFYQLIHQGTEIVPCDFVGFVRPSDPLTDHHRELMTNFLAQPDALAFGKDSDDPARNFSGNRPSSSLLLQELTPFTAGLLLAWTEHRATTKGFIWDINSFDQFGVELGKKLGVAAREAMQGDQDRINSFNPSTRKLFNAIMQGKLPK